MTARRGALMVTAGIVLLAAFYFFATPLSWFLYRVGVEVDPARVSWDGKTAWIRCESAIAGKTAWPDTAPAACQAMHLCAN